MELQTFAARVAIDRRSLRDSLADVAGARFIKITVTNYQCLS